MAAQILGRLDGNCCGMGFIKLVRGPRTAVEV